MHVARLYYFEKNKRPDVSNFQIEKGFADVFNEQKNPWLLLGIKNKVNFPVSLIVLFIYG